MSAVAGAVCPAALAAYGFNGWPDLVTAIPGQGFFAAPALRSPRP